MATQHVKRNLLLNLYRERKTYLWFVSSCRLREIKVSDTCSLFPPFGGRPLAFLPVTLLLPHNCTHFTCQQSNAQNSPNQASTVHEQRASRCSSWIQQRQRSQRSNFQYSLDIIEKAREFQKNIDFIEYAKVFDCADHNKLWEILKEMGIPDHLICLLRSLYAGQEATVTTRHGRMDWFLIRKGVHQDCILSPCLFNLYASTSC